MEITHGGVMLLDHGQQLRPIAHRNEGLGHRFFHELLLVRCPEARCARAQDTVHPDRARDRHVWFARGGPEKSSIRERGQEHREQVQSWRTRFCPEPMMNPRERLAGRVAEGGQIDGCRVISVRQGVKDRGVKAAPHQFLHQRVKPRPDLFGQGFFGDFKSLKRFNVRIVRGTRHWNPEQLRQPGEQDGGRTRPPPVFAKAETGAVDFVEGAHGVRAGPANTISGCFSKSK